MKRGDVGPKMICFLLGDPIHCLHWACDELQPRADKAHNEIAAMIRPTVTVYTSRRQLQRRDLWADG